MLVNDVYSLDFILEPLDNQNGSTTFLTQFADSFGASVSEEFSVTVNPVNDLPVIVSSVENQRTNEDVDLTFTLRVYDPDIVEILKQLIQQFQLMMLVYLVRNI